MTAPGLDPAHLTDVLTLTDDLASDAWDPRDDETLLEIFSPVLDLNLRAFDTLLAYGLTTVADIEALSDAAMLRLSGINEPTLVHIRARVIDYRRSQRLAREHYERAGGCLAVVSTPVAAAA